MQAQKMSCAAPLNPRTWHTLKLTLVGPQITAGLDGAKLGTAVDAACLKGMAAIGSGWNCAEFGNFAIRPISGQFGAGQKGLGVAGTER